MSECPISLARALDDRPSLAEELALLGAPLRDQERARAEEIGRLARFVAYLENQRKPTPCRVRAVRPTKE